MGIIFDFEKNENNNSYGVNFAFEGEEDIQSLNSIDTQEYQKAQVPFEKEKKILLDSGINVDDMPEQLRDSLLRKISDAKREDEINRELWKEARYGNAVSFIGSKAIDNFAKVYYDSIAGITKTWLMPTEISSNIGEIIANKIDNENLKTAVNLVKTKVNNIKEFLNNNEINNALNSMEEQEKERIREYYANGEWGKALAEYITNGAYKAIALTSVMSNLPGGIFGRTTPVDKIKYINWSALERAGLIGLGSFITTNGEISDKFKAGALTALFASTSAISSLAPKDWQAKVADVFLNIGVNINAYKDVIQQEFERSKKSDGTVELNWGRLVAELSNVATTDVIFGLMQESAKAKNKAYAKTEKISDTTTTITKEQTEQIKQEDTSVKIEDKAKAVEDTIKNLDEVNKAETQLTQKQAQEVDEYLSKFKDKGIDIETISIGDKIEVSLKDIEQDVRDILGKEKQEEFDISKNYAEDTQVEAANDAFDAVKNIKENKEDFKEFLNILSFNKSPSIRELDSAVEKKLIEYSKKYLDSDNRGMLLNILSSNIAPDKKADKVINFIEKAVAKNLVKYNTIGQKYEEAQLKNITENIKALKEDISKIIPKEIKDLSKIKEDIKLSEENRKLAMEIIPKIFNNKLIGSKEKNTALSLIAKKQKFSDKELAEVLVRGQELAEKAYKKQAVETVKRNLKKSLFSIDEWDTELDVFKPFIQNLSLKEKTLKDGKYVLTENTIEGIDKVIDYIKNNEDIRNRFEEEEILDFEKLKNKKQYELDGDDIFNINKLVGFINALHNNNKITFADGRVMQYKEAKKKILESFNNNEYLGYQKKEKGLFSYLNQHLPIYTRLRFVSEELSSAIKGMYDKGLQEENLLLPKLKKMLEEKGIKFSRKELSRFTNAYSLSGINPELLTKRIEIKFDNAPKEISFTGDELANLYLTLKDNDGYKAMTENGITLANGQKIAAILKTKDKTGKKISTFIPLLTENDIKKIESSLTEKEKAFADTVFEWHNKEIRDEINEGARRNLGYNLISDDTPHWSIKREGLLVKKEDGINVIQEEKGTGIEISRPSITKKRTGGNAPLVIDGLIKRIASESSLVHAYKAHNTNLYNIKRLLKDPDIYAMIVNKYGDEFYGRIMKHHSSIISNIEKHSFIDEVVGEKTAKVVGSVMALSGRSILKQPLASFTAHSILGDKIFKHFFNPVLSNSKKAIIKEVIDRNILLKERLEQNLMGKEIGAIKTSLNVIDSIFGYKPLISAQYKFLEGADSYSISRNIITAVDVVAEKYGLTLDDILNNSPEYIKQKNNILSDASNLAWDSISRGGQAVSNSVYLSEFQVTNPRVKSIIGYWHSQADQIVTSFIESYLDYRAGKKSTTDFLKSSFIGLLAASVMPTVIDELYSELLSSIENIGLDSDEIKEKEDRLSKKLKETFGDIKGSVANFIIKSASTLAETFYGGEIIAIIESLLRYGNTRKTMMNNPLFTLINNALNSAYKASQGISIDENLNIEEVDIYKTAPDLLSLLGNFLSYLGIANGILTDMAKIKAKRKIKEREM